MTLNRIIRKYGLYPTMYNSNQSTIHKQTINNMTVSMIQEINLSS